VAAELAAVGGAHRGFVVSDISYVLSKDAAETGACPAGRTAGVPELFKATPEGQQRVGESDAEYARRVFQGSSALETASNGQNECQVPELTTPDPHHYTVTGAGVHVNGGLDLDGQDSRVKGRAAPGTCPHDDFSSFDGQQGIDNQFFRAVGCMPSFQPTGSSIPWAIEMLTGSWGILVTLDGVQDLSNDPSVDVDIYANADPIQLSPNRVPLPDATYSVHNDPRFHSHARGRIVNGVLTTEQFDFAVPKITNNVHFVRTLKHARIEATVGKDGALDGFLAGYTPVVNLYDFQFALRNGTTATGAPSPPRRASIGRSLGFTCRGIYHALLQHADGDRDPASGQCTSISTQYHFHAIPAFVVTPESDSRGATAPEGRT
jgi:hypothetical protein